MRSLTMQFVPYSEIEQLSSVQRIYKLLSIVKKDRIVVLEGRLKKEEEADLIKITMQEIDSKFKGIELGVIYPESKDASLRQRIKQGIISFILGNRQGLTIIGPASFVKQIKRNPDKIELLMKEPKKK